MTTCSTPNNLKTSSDFEEKEDHIILKKHDFVK